MFNKRITQADLEKAVMRAASEAALNAKIDAFGAAFNSHQIQCKQDKEDIRRALEGQDNKRFLMHQENQVQFNKVNSIILKATGAWGMLTFLVTIGITLWGFFHK